jgi:SAM-dependent methyltransferase
MIRPIRDRVHQLAERIENKLFDYTRNVQTSGHLSLRRIGVAEKDLLDSEGYVPARAANVRRAIVESQIKNYPECTFVDLGSGKGRALFVAAELPFKEIVGVEFSQLLHRLAVENIASFSYRPNGCHSIHSVHANAMEFKLPPGPLVLYMFNPFGPETMQRILENLAESLRDDPRPVTLILLWPRCAGLMADLPQARLKSATRRHQIFEITPQ